MQTEWTRLWPLESGLPQSICQSLHQPLVVWFKTTFLVRIIVFRLQKVFRQPCLQWLLHAQKWSVEYFIGCIWVGWSIVYVCLYVSGYSHAGVVVDKCTYGPSYWCSSLPAAKDCGAMQHCMTATWKNNAPMEKVCFLQKFICSQLRTIWAMS